MTAAQAPSGSEVGPAPEHPEQDTDETVVLLDVDEELSASIPEADYELARRNLTAPVRRSEPGCHDDLGWARGGSGMLVVEGFLTRDVEFAGERSRELLGSGDLLRPWEVERDFHPPFSSARYTVMEPTTFALLDHRVLQVGARWPDLVDELLRRTLDRARWLAIRLAIGGVTRIDERVLLFLWHAAGRWGRVTREGVALPFRLTHEELAELVGAKRPSVTTALNKLRDDGKISFEPHSPGAAFVLLGDPPGD
jgi:hypothetical protein